MLKRTIKVVVVVVVVRGAERRVFTELVPFGSKVAPALVRLAPVDQPKSGVLTNL
jgi:hypothetical protein